MTKLDQTTRNYLSKLRQDIVFSETARDQHLTYHTTWGLFSPKNLDNGSLLLLDYLQINEDDDTLDLGCGYGPLGLTMARLAPKGSSLLIVSNLPAKTGKELYYLYFYDALERLNPGGRIYVVTISGLRKFIQRAFQEVFGNYKKLKQGRTYTVAVRSTIAQITTIILCLLPN